MYVHIPDGYIYTGVLIEKHPFLIKTFIHFIFYRCVRRPTSTWISRNYNWTKEKTEYSRNPKRPHRTTNFWILLRKILFKLIRKIKFRNQTYNFQWKIRTDIEDIKNPKKIWVRADKLKNINKITLLDHNRIQQNKLQIRQPGYFITN